MSRVDPEEALVPKIRALVVSAITAGRQLGHLELTLALNPGLRGDVSPAMVYRALCAAGFTLDRDGHVVRP